MPAVLLTEAELDALAGLPHLAIAIYLALRRRMDLETALVGARFGVSWQAITEDVYIDPHRGRAARAPGREAVRRGVQWLVPQLVQMRSRVAEARLIFFLPRARTLSLAQRKTDRKPTGYPDRVATEGESTETRQGAKRANRQTSEVRVIQPAAAAATASGIEKEGAAAADDFLFPKGTTSGQREAIARMLAAKGIDREGGQLVIDELAGIMRARQVHNPAALAATIAAQLERGELYAVHAERERGCGRSLSPEELRFIDEGGRP